MYPQHEKKKSTFHCPTWLKEKKWLVQIPIHVFQLCSFNICLSFCYTISIVPSPILLKYSKLLRLPLSILGNYFSKQTGCSRKCPRLQMELDHTYPMFFFPFTLRPVERPPVATPALTARFLSPPAPIYNITTRWPFPSDYRHLNLFSHKKQTSKQN